MKTKNQSKRRLSAYLSRAMNGVIAFCMVLGFGFAELQAQQVADFTNTVTILPDGSPQLTNSISIDAGDSFDLVVGVSSPEGLMVGSVTATILWDGNFLSMSNPTDATMGGVGASWFPLGSPTPIVVTPEGDAPGELTWAKGDLFGTSPGMGDFPFLKATFTANADLQNVNLTEIVHMTSGAKASLITQPNVAPDLTDITGAVPSLEVEITGEVVDVPGCTNMDACNYDPLATVDDESCILPVENCTVCNDEGGVDLIDSDGDGVCDADEIAGCTDELACNYNQNATDEDDSCVFADGDCEYCNFDEGTVEETVVVGGALSFADDSESQTQCAGDDIDYEVTLVANQGPASL